MLIDFGGYRMNINKKFICILLLILTVFCISTSVAYTGTGFTHNIPDNYYSSMSTQDILGKYNDTYLTSEERSVCTKVVDGDTIYLSNGRKIRMVGVNTPEKGVRGYSASKNFVQKLCLNKEVGINIDDKKYYDKYGRTLAVVIVDGKNLNEMLLKEGLAEVMFIPPSEFSPYKWTGTSTTSSNYQTTATTTSSKQSVSSSKNIASSSDSSSDYVGNVNSHKFHEAGCTEVDRMSEKNKVYFSSRQDAINEGYTGCKKCNP